MTEVSYRLRGSTADPDPGGAPVLGDGREVLGELGVAGLPLRRAHPPRAAHGGVGGAGDDLRADGVRGVDDAAEVVLGGADDGVLRRDELAARSHDEGDGGGQAQVGQQRGGRRRVPVAEVLDRQLDEVEAPSLDRRREPAQGGVRQGGGPHPRVDADGARRRREHLRSVLSRRTGAAHSVGPAAGRALVAPRGRGLIGPARPSGIRGGPPRRTWRSAGTASRRCARGSRPGRRR